MSFPLLYLPSILLHFDGTSGSTVIIDSSPNDYAMTAHGNAAISTSSPAPEFGSGSLISPASVYNSDYVSTPITAGSPLDIGSTTGNFTVEFSVNFPSTAEGAGGIFNFSTGAGPSLAAFITPGGGGQIITQIGFGAGYLSTGNSTSISSSSWYQVAIVRQSGTIYTYLNGVQQVHLITGSITTFNSTALQVGDVYVGGSGTGAAVSIDEFRVTRAALYSGSYIPATSAFSVVAPLTTNNGDITDPFAWVEGASGSLPPPEYVGSGGLTPVGTTGDGRYYWTGNATIQTGSCIGFVGGSNYLVDTASLQWTILQASSDGSTPVLQYCTDGHTYTSVSLGSAGTFQSVINESGQIPVTLTSGASFYVNVQGTGGTVTAGAQDWVVGVAITRNANEKIAWDSPDPFDPVGYNGLVIDNNVPTATMASLSSRLLVRLGFASQAAKPPPGMAALVQDFLTSAQTFLYRRYLQLHTKRMFRWKVNPGQRYYSLLDNDENVLEGVNPDYAKTIEWAGIQDSRNVWYPLIQGIPPQLYTMITKPWRPARYEIRGSIELYPAPDQTYWLWMKGHFGLMPFTLSTQSTTIDSELVFLHALANAKSHYGQPDANNIEAQANAYRAELIAATHQTAHYLPGTIAVPPAVRPTLIQFDNGGGGS